MKNLLKTNWFLFAVSVLCAFVIWLYVVYEVEPSYETTIRNVPITMTKYSDDFANGKLITLSQSHELVDIRIKGKRQLIAKVTRDNVSCSVNLSDINSEGTYKLPINVAFDQSGVELVSKDPYNVKVKVDEVITIEKKITVDIKGKPAKNYVYDGVEYSTDTVRLTGARSIVNKVKSAKVKVDISGKKESMNGRFKVGLYDAKGSELESDFISKNISYVEITCNILKEKKIPVKVIMTTEETSDGKTIGISEMTYSEVTVVGTENALDSLDEIRTQEVSTAYVSDGDKLTVTLEELPKNVNFKEKLDDLEVTFEVK